MRFLRAISKWIDAFFTWGNQSKQHTVVAFLIIGILFTILLLLLSILPPLFLVPIVYPLFPWVISMRDRPKGGPPGS
jgi:hypothetical protein